VLLPPGPDQTIVAPLPCHTTREKRKVEIFRAGSLAAASPESRQTAAHTGGPEMHQRARRKCRETTQHNLANINPPIAVRGGVHDSPSDIMTIMRICWSFADLIHGMTTLIIISSPSSFSCLAYILFPFLFCFGSEK